MHTSKILKDIFNSWYKRVLFSENRTAASQYDQNRAAVPYEILDKPFMLFNYQHKEWYSSIKKLIRVSANGSAETIVGYKFVIPFDIKYTLEETGYTSLINYIVDVTNILFKRTSSSFTLSTKRIQPHQLYVKLKNDDYEIVYRFRQGCPELRYEKRMDFIKIANIA